MLAPTHITGPDGTKCPKGKKIPAGWFDEMPDLQAHLDAITAAGATTDPAPAATETTDATMVITRKRDQS